MPKIEALMSLTEGGARIGISRSQMYRLVEQGEIEVVMCGKTMRVTESQLAAYVAAHKTTHRKAARR